MLEQQRSTLTELIKTIHYMDVDSPRFIDYLTLQRAKDGLQHTGSARHLISNTNIQATINEMIEMLPSVEEMLEIISTERGVTLTLDNVLVHEHVSDSIFRRFIIEGGSVALMFSIGADNVALAASAVGCPKAVHDTIELYRERYSKRRTVNYEHLVGYGQDGAIVKTTILEVDEAKKWVGTDAFYPFIEGGIESLAKEYGESRAPILLLIGARGLGKTTLIRSLNVLLGRDTNVLANDEEVITDPQFMPYIHSLDDNLTISIEDADNLLAKRDDGNRQMSALLSFADGVVKTSTRVIISTNLSSLIKVDSALYRRGRTFKVISFRELTCEEANLARESIGLPPVVFGEHLTSISLADALNYSDVDHTGGSITKAGF